MTNEDLRDVNENYLCSLRNAVSALRKVKNIVPPSYRDALDAIIGSMPESALIDDPAPGLDELIVVTTTITGLTATQIGEK